LSTLVPLSTGSIKITFFAYNMLSKEEVKHVARLARIKLTEEEMQKMQGELVKILDYIEKLKELDVENLEPTTHSILIKNVFI